MIFADQEKKILVNQVLQGFKLLHWHDPPTPSLGSQTTEHFVWWDIHTPIFFCTQGCGAVPDSLLLFTHSFSVLLTFSSTFLEILVKPTKMKSCPGNQECLQVIEWMIPSDVGQSSHHSIILIYLANLKSFIGRMHKGWIFKPMEMQGGCSIMPNNFLNFTEDLISFVWN